MSIVWRDVALDEPRLRLDDLASTAWVHLDRVRAQVIETRAWRVLRPVPAAPRITWQPRTVLTGARW